MALKKSEVTTLTEETNFDPEASSKMPESTILYRVKTDGYIEQFSSFNLARRVYDRIKKARIEEEEEFKLCIEKFENGQWVELDYVMINDAYYNWAK